MKQIYPKINLLFIFILCACINLDSPEKINSIELINILGKSVRTFKNKPTGRIQIPTEEILHGTYFLKINYGKDCTLIKKVVKS